MHSSIFSILGGLAAMTSAEGAGQSTFYGGNLNGGMCYFSTYTLPSAIYGTALSGQNWNSSANCGACLRVTGPSGNSIIAMIVEQCPECPANGLDLFQDAFEQLADASEGIIQVQWEWTGRGIHSPLQVHMKEGADADLEVSTDGGSTWQDGLQRQPYNFFGQSSGFGTDAVVVRAVGADGGSAVAEDVAVMGDNLVAANGNF